jgi:undecaprenyl-phosphate galactose phosphotransferase
MNAAMERHLQYSFIPGESEFYSGKNQTDIFLGYPMISVYQTPLVGWGEVVKRIFDMTMIIVSSPVWVPFMLLMMALQKIFNPGPIFYKSKRLGLHGKTIYTYKFRSMMQKYSGEKAEDIFAKMGRDDLVSEYIAHRKVKHDPRITWFGNILRVTSIDELPQIFNVIIGEMSLVGPRPIIKEERTYYKHRAPLLFSVRPGITGLWQVSGRSDLSFNERVELELFYAQNWSFWLDIKILFKTIGAVVARRGAE